MSQDKVSNLSYLNQTMGGNKRLVKEIIEVFLKQAPEELSHLSVAINRTDYGVIKGLAKTMKSSASIMDISSVRPLLNQIETLAHNSESIQQIREINTEVQGIFNQAIREMEIEITKYN